MTEHAEAPDKSEDQRIFEGEKWLRRSKQGLRGHDSLGPFFVVVGFGNVRATFIKLRSTSSSGEKINLFPGVMISIDGDPDYRWERMTRPVVLEGLSYWDPKGGVRAYSRRVEKPSRSTAGRHLKDRDEPAPMVRVLLSDLESITSENARLRGRVDELQRRMSEMVVERQAASRYGGRDRRQKMILGWALRVFGPQAGSLWERAMRLAEEAMEAAQAAGVDYEKILNLAIRVYGRPPGELRRELGAVSVTLAAFCEVAGLSADEVERDEVDRVLSVPEEQFQKRQAERVAAGLGLGAEVAEP